MPSMPPMSSVPDHVVLNSTGGRKSTSGRVERVRDGAAIRPTEKLSESIPPTFNCGHPPDPCREIVTEMAQNFVKTCHFVPLFSTTVRTPFQSHNSQLGTRFAAARSYVQHRVA